MELNFYATLVSLVIVLLLGRFIVSKIGFLSYYNIPEPVVGGVIVAIGLFILAHYFGFKISFDASLQEPLLLAFYASIGLSADFASLKKGGKILIVFLLVVLGLLVTQNVVGVLLAELMGVNPLIGLLGGSITMSGGHGTGAAWAEVFKASPYHFTIADGVAMACATFGLIAGGIIGGPVAHYLMKRHKLDPKAHNKDFENMRENIERISGVWWIEKFFFICFFFVQARNVIPQFRVKTAAYCQKLNIPIFNAAFNDAVHRPPVFIFIFFNTKYKHYFVTSKLLFCHFRCCV